MAHPDATQWELTCNNEKCVFEHLGIYKVIPRPVDRKVVGSKWVFCIKCRPDGSIQKYKACIIAQGFMQIEGVNYNETFAPIAKLASLCAILAIAAERDLELHQMNVTVSPHTSTAALQTKFSWCCHQDSMSRKVWFSAS